MITFSRCRRVSTNLRLPAAVSPGRVATGIARALAREIVTAASSLLDHDSRARAYTAGKQPACSRPDRFKVFINDGQRRRVADIFYCSFRNERGRPRGVALGRRENEAGRKRDGSYPTSGVASTRARSYRAKRTAAHRLFGEMDRKIRKSRRAGFRNEISGVSRQPGGKERGEEGRKRDRRMNR